MRADRLVATLLLLQARVRVTAAEVARELEVSVKTARRDLEALSTAGIPVYSQPGRSGGWSLVGGARTDLTGLTAAEARALFLIAGPSASVAPEAKAALRKLVRALPEPFRAEAEAAAAATVIDETQWGGETVPPPPHLHDLQRAVIEGVAIRLRYTSRNTIESERMAHPLGLVEKRGAWYLVAGTDAGLRTFHVGRIRSLELTDEPVVRPPDFDLEVAWRSTVATVEGQLGAIVATVRIPREALPWLRGQFGRAMTVSEDANDGRLVAQVRGTTAETIAQQLAGWGRDLELVNPPEVGDHLARIGAELVARYAKPD